LRLPEWGASETLRRWARISPPPPPSPDLRGAAVRQGLVRRDGMPWKPQPCPRTHRRSHRPRPHPALALAATAHREKEGPRKNRATEREGPACVGPKRIIRENTVVLQSYSEQYFSILDLLFYPQLCKIISKIENFPLFSCADLINFSIHPVRMVPPFSIHLVPLGTS